MILTVFPTFYAKRLNRFRRYSIFFKIDLIFKSFDHKKTNDLIEKPMINSQPCLLENKWWWRGGGSMVEVLWLMSGHVVAPWLRCCGS